METLKYRSGYTSGNAPHGRYLNKTSKECYNISGRKKIASLVAGILLILSPAAFSQDSLSVYLKAAAVNNPALKASYNEYLASLERVPQVGALPDPELTFGYFIKPKEELMGQQVADIQVMQMFPWFGTLAASKSEASAMAKAKFEAFSENRNKLFFDLKSLYYQIYRLNKEIVLSEKNLAYLKSYEKLSMVRFQSGGSAASVAPSEMPKQAPSGTSTGSMGTMGGNATTTKPAPAMPQAGEGMTSGKGMVDVLSVQMELKELENTLQYLKEKKKPLVTALNNFMRRPANAPVFIPDSISIPDLALVSITPDSLQKNPMIRMYQAEQESYEAMLQKSKKMGYPMLGVGFEYMLLKQSMDATSMDNGKDMVMPMVKISLPIFRKKYKAMQREAGFMTESSLQKQADMVNNLTTEFETTLADFNNNSRKVALYGEQSALAQQSLDILTSQYATAGNNLEDLLKMQQKLLDLGFKKTDAMAEQLTMLAKLEYLVAKPVVDDENTQPKN